MSEWQSKELSPQKFTICIVTLNLQKRQMPKTERFAAKMCYAKLFQVSVGRSSHTVFFSLLRMIAKKERVNLRGANGSPKNALILDTPASPLAVRLPR